MKVQFRFLLVLVCLLASISPAKAAPDPFVQESTFSNPHPGNSLHLKVDIGTGGSESTEDYRSSQVFSLFGKASLEYPLGSGFSFQGTLNATLEQGHAQSYLTNEFAPQNSVALSEALLRFDPAPFMTIAAGAKNMSTPEIPNFIFDSTFPAVVERGSFETQWVRTTLVLQQAIPTSQAMLDQKSDSSAVPFFEQESLSATWIGSDPISATVEASHFSFSGLPSAVAQESRFGGNTVTGLGPTGAQFAYGFNGFTVGARFRLMTEKRVSAELSVEGMKNFQAPDGQNEGYFARLSVPVRLSQDLTFSPQVASFLTESDVVPGAYNSQVFGHGNRRGFSVGGELSMHGSGLTLLAEWVQANAFQANPYQGNLGFIQVALRKSYAIF